MATIKKYNGSTWENAVVRKYGTASEIITPPTTIYADGTAISTYSIKGNTVQNGTPTPSNPVAVVGVGELETTGEHTGEYKIPILTAQGTSNIYLSEPLYKIGDYADVINADGTVSRRIAKLTFNGDGSVTWNKSSTYQGSFYAYNALVGGLNLWTPMVCTHATWVYPIDVSHYVYGTFGADGSPPSPNLNLFIGQADWNVTQFNQFLAENPVTVYYVLATATTEQITLPTIATTDGANSITVDTTVQPSEFIATWTGWHDSSVKEYDGSQWQ